MNIIELRVKLGVFKEMNMLQGIDLQPEIDERFKEIFNQLDKVNKGETIEKVESTPYLDLIEKISRVFINATITDDLCSYFNFLTEVLYNWSSNCVKDKKIETFSLMLNRLIEVRNRMNCSIDIMKDVYERYVDLANWQPPIFDLAINYFDKLLEENEKGKQSENCLHKE